MENWKENIGNNNIDDHDDDITTAIADHGWENDDDVVYNIDINGMENMFDHGEPL
jgi:hypothetical protein